MPDYQITSISITGYAGRPVPNLFFRQAQAANTLGVILPGLRYTCDMPLLYYAAQLLLQRKGDVLQLHTNYTGLEYQRAAPSEQARWLAEDALSAVQAGKAQRAYQRLVLVGKSIGTLALAYLVNAPLGAEASAIWLTPLLHQAQLVEAALRAKGPALFICGSGDPTYDAAAFQRLAKRQNATGLLIEAANHSLEIPGDLFRSLQMINHVVHGMADFLEASSPR
jgi:dienelactone hydrolase